MHGPRGALFVDLTLQNRSMMEIMNFAAYGVNVPEAHIAEGVADADHAEIISRLEDFTGPKHLFTVHSSRRKPRNATVKVRHRDYWFYIDDSDLQSRTTFGLLNALFAVTAGTVPGAKPVLTLPVG